MSRIRGRPAGLALLAALILLAIPAAAFADALPHDGSFILQAKADITVPAGEHRDAVIVFEGDATIEGEVNTVIVVDGTATLTGARVEALIVAGGTADVGAGSNVDQVRVLDSVYHAAPGATVGSYDSIEPAAVAAAIAPVALAIWAGFAIAYLLVGLIVAAIAGGQLRRAGAALTGEPGAVTLAAVGLLVGMPLLVLLLAATVIGIPSALVVALIGLPIIWFVGSLAVAVRIGDWMLLRLRGTVEAAHPVVAAFIGMLVVGLLSVVPLLGFVIGLAGAGAAVLVGWRAAFGDRPVPASPSPQPGAMPA